MSFFSKIIGETGSGLVKSVGEVADKFITTKQEKETFKKELLQLEQEHQVKLLEAHNSDLVNARDLQKAALTSNDKFTRRFIYYLALLVILAAIGFGIGLFLVEIPEGNKRMVEMFADIFMFAGAVMVLQFFFGSSAGSKEKTEKLKS